MADKPIIFSAPMVRALFDGRKTQTRRLLKPQPDPGLFFGHMTYVEVLRLLICRNATGMRQDIRVPYAIGDRLWVREGFGICHSCGQPIYRADIVETDDRGMPICSCDAALGRWRSSIHMPRWASRLTLTVTDVRVQRLQEISEADAVAEGVPHIHEGNIGDEPYCLKCEGRGVHGAFGAGYGVAEVDCSECVTARQKFRNLWSSLHGPEAWDANPWVAAYTFTVQRGNIDSQEGM